MNVSPILSGDLVIMPGWYAAEIIGKHAVGKPWDVGISPAKLRRGKRPHARSARDIKYITGLVFKNVGIGSSGGADYFSSVSGVYLKCSAVASRNLGSASEKFGAGRTRGMTTGGVPLAGRAADQIKKHNVAIFIKEGARVHKRFANPVSMGHIHLHRPFPIVLINSITAHQAWGVNVQGIPFEYKIGDAAGIWGVAGNGRPGGAVV
jgi:hypothetical protein